MAMISGLVADYGSSDSEFEEHPENLPLKEEGIKKCIENYFEVTPEDKQTSKNIPKKKKAKKILANPLRNKSASKAFLEPSSSVFYNPFQKEQEAKKSVLEKHVKLTNNPKDVLEINGKKICWNYRKGRCKFGHKCKYAHDSDLEGSSVNQNNKTFESFDTYFPSGEISFENETSSSRKRKPGLAKGLIPNKRSQKLYKEIQAKEAPWLNKR